MNKTQMTMKIMKLYAKLPEAGKRQFEADVKKMLRQQNRKRRAASEELLK